MKLKNMVLKQFNGDEVIVSVVLLKELLHKVQQLQAIIDFQSCGDLFDACDFCSKTYDRYGCRENTCDFKFELKEK